jgi:CBS domain-containing protein
MSLDGHDRVKDVMSEPLETISRDATVGEAAAEMREKGISALVVTMSPPSIVTSTDVLDAVADGRDAASLSVTEIMTKSVETVPPNLQTAEVAAMMISLGITHLPVKDGSDYVGMVSSTDLTAAIS